MIPVFALPVLLSWIVAKAPGTVAGPPLALEDPGILEPGQWEIITSTSLASFGGGDIYELPSLDVSLGVLAEQVQISAAYRFVVAHPDGSESESDFGNPQLGLKWRFLHTGALQLAVGAAYSFGISRALSEVGVGDDTDVLELPLALAYQLRPDLRFNGAISYISVAELADGWGYNAALAYSLNDRWELLAELAGAASESFNQGIVDVRAGFDFAVTPGFHLLFSVATGLQEPGPEAKLHHDIFLGLQFFY